MDDQDPKSKPLEASPQGRPGASLLVEEFDHVRLLMLNEPERRNPLSVTLRSALTEALITAADDPRVRCIMLTGAGSAFCSGGDVRAMGSRTPISLYDHMSGSRRMLECLASLRKPVIAAVNGPAAGAGVGLALACDVVVAARSAWFTMAFAARGLIPDTGAAYFLTRQLGSHQAKALCFSGKRISAAEAQSLGIVSEVWADEEFDERSRDYCRQIATGPTVALGLTKALINSSMSGDLNQSLMIESGFQAIAASTVDHSEGIASFKEHRIAKFTGR